MLCVGIKPVETAPTVTIGASETLLFTVLGEVSIVILFLAILSPANQFENDGNYGTHNNASAK